MGLPRHLAERGETCCLRAWNLPLDFLQSLTLNGRPNQHSYPNHPALADPWGQPNASLDSHFISIGSDSSAIRESTRRHRSQTPSRRFRSFDPRDPLTTGRQCELIRCASISILRPPQPPAVRLHNRATGRHSDAPCPAAWWEPNCFSRNHGTVALHR